MQLSLRQLEVFLCVADFGSFSEAAKSLHVSQPALTRTIQQIESTLGARLFDRNTRKVELTPAGADILPIARHLLGEFKSACNQMSQSVERLNGKINVAAPPSLAATLLPPIIALFVAKHPEVEVQISEIRSVSLPEALTDGSCDFGLSARPTKASNIAYRELFKDEMFMICRDDDPLASRKVVPWSVFATRPFISMVQGCSIRALAEEAFASVNLDVKPQYECEHLSTLCSLISAGLGISAVSLIMSEQIGLERIAARPLIEPSVARSVGIVTCSLRPLSTIAGQFMKTVAEEVARVRNAAISSHTIPAPVSGPRSHRQGRIVAVAGRQSPRPLSRQ